MPNERRSNAPRARPQAALRALALPLLVQEVAHLALGIGDVLVVARVGTEELAAVGLASAIFLAVTVLYRSTLMTSAVFVGRAHGARDARGVGEAFWTGLGLAALMTLTLPALPALFRALVTLTVGGEPLIAEHALHYLTIRTLEAPALMLVTLVWAVYVGRSRTRVPSALAWTAVTLNLLLDVALVLGLGPMPALGLAGAAWATVIAQSVTAVVALAALATSRDAQERDVLRPRRPKAAQLLELVRLGLPKGIGDLGTVLAYAFFVGGIARLGSEALAVSNVARQVDMVSIALGRSLAQALATLVAQAIGADDRAAVRPLVRAAALQAAVVMGAVGAAWSLAPQAVLGVFIEDPRLVSSGVGVLWVMAAYKPLHGVALVLEGAMTSLGLTRLSMLARLSSGFLLFVPLSVVLAGPAGLGLVGAWIAPAAWVVVLVVIFWVAIAAATAPATTAAPGEPVGERRPVAAG